MSKTRTIRRAIDRTETAIDMLFVDGRPEPHTVNTRMALAGNTSAAMRRRAAKRIAKYETFHKVSLTADVRKRVLVLEAQGGPK